MLHYDFLFDIVALQLSDYCYSQWSLWDITDREAWKKIIMKVEGEGMVANSKGQWVDEIKIIF